MRVRTILIIALHLFLIGTTNFGGAAAFSQPAARPASTPNFSYFLRTELFFGMDKPTGGQVTEAEWQTFLEGVVTPRFPDGLTVDDALGQYLDGKTLVRERSKQIILIYPRRSKTSSSRKTEEIRRAYIKAFDQKSVLRVDLPYAVLVSF